MRKNRDFPAWALVAVAAAGCATAESDDPGSESDLTQGGSPSHGGSGSAGKLGSAGTTGTPNNGSSGSGGGGHAGSATGGAAGKTTGGAAGNAQGGGDEGGSSTSGSSTGGKAGAAGGGGVSGSSAGTSQGGKSGSSSGGSAGSGTAGSGTAGSGGGGGKLGCDDQLYLLCDDFEDGNADGWSTTGGTWTVLQSGSFVYKGANGGYFALAGDESMTDQIVEAKVKGIVFGGSGSSYRVGVVARHTSNSFYAVVLDEAGDLRVLRGSSSPSSASGTCDSVPVSPNAAGFTLRLAVTGPSGNVNLKSYLDGTLVHDCTTKSSTLANGSAGVYTYGSKTVAEFDDFKVSVP